MIHPNWKNSIHPFSITVTHRGAGAYPSSLWGKVMCEFWFKKQKQKKTISSCKAHWYMLWVLQRVMVVVAVRQLEWKTSTWQLSSKCSIKQDYYVPLVVIATQHFIAYFINKSKLSFKSFSLHSTRANMWEMYKSKRGRMKRMRIMNKHSIQK